MRYVRGFGHFWWDFLVGDTPEIFAGSFVVIGVAALVSKLEVAGVFLFLVPTAVVVLLALSIRLGKGS